jgi:YVTN family beta-propeller protein
MWIVGQGEDGLFKLENSPVNVGNKPMAATILPDGSRLYLLNKGGISNSISVIDTSGLEVDTVYLPETIGSISLNGITVSPDGKNF